MKTKRTALWLLAMAATLAQASEVRFTRINEEVEDTPIKARIQLDVLATGAPTEAEIRTELERRFQRARQRSGFRHHRQVTAVYIYIYGSREQAAAGQGLWVGMVSWTSQSGAAAQYRIDQGRLDAMASPPEDRGGLSEQDRRQIFRQLVQSQDRALDEATKQIPDSRWEEQLDLESRLQERYRQEVLDRWEITDRQAKEISLEAMQKGWPLP